MDKKLNQDELLSIANISTDIQKIKDIQCNKPSDMSVCLITPSDIKNISYFLSHKLPKCKKLNITLNDIKNGNFLSSRSSGYSFLIT